MKQEIIEVLKRPGILRKGKFVLKGGQESNFYIDVKRAYGVSGFLKIACENLYNISDKNATCIAGMGVGGLPLVSTLGVLYPRRICLVREKPRDHGIRSRMEGYVPKKEDKVVIFDDVFSMGTSLKKTTEEIESTGAKVIQACVIVKRGKSQLSFPLASITTMEELL